MNLNRVITGLTSRSVNGGLVAGLLANGPVHVAKGSDDPMGGAFEIGAIAWTACKAFRGRPDWDAPLSDSVATGWRDLGRAHFLPQDPYSQDFLEFLLMRAMIAAASAGRRVGGYQRAAITERIGAMELSADEKVFLIGEINTPLPLTKLMDYTKGPDLAALVYTASAIAAEDSDANGWQYLATLAAELALPEDLVEDIHHLVDVRRNAARTRQFTPLQSGNAHRAHPTVRGSFRRLLASQHLALTEIVRTT